ncbi:MAG: RNA polymerase-binding protein DksA [Thiohalobacteraceae bacterium]
MATTKKSATKKKTVIKKTATKSAPAKKAAIKKAPAKKATAPKAAAKKSATRKPTAAKKVVTRKATATTKAVSKKAAAPPAAKARAKKASAPKRTAAAKPTAGTSSTLIDSIEPYRETPGEDYMNDTQREHFRNILRAWKRELMEEVDRTVHHMQDEAANFPDPNDRATQESEFSMELRTRDRERKLIKKIDETLGKLDHDDYGYCESCGIEIGIRRLEARPTAALCIDCKTLDEIREKQMGG